MNKVLLALPLLLGSLITPAQVEAATCQQGATGDRICTERDGRDYVRTNIRFTNGSKYYVNQQTFSCTDDGRAYNVRVIRNEFGGEPALQASRYTTCKKHGFTYGNQPTPTYNFETGQIEYR